MLAITLVAWFFWYGGDLKGPFISERQCQIVRQQALDVSWHKRWTLPYTISKCFEA